MTWNLFMSILQTESFAHAQTNHNEPAEKRTSLVALATDLAVEDVKPVVGHLGHSLVAVVQSVTLQEGLKHRRLEDLDQLQLTTTLHLKTLQGITKCCDTNSPEVAICTVSRSKLFNNNGHFFSTLPIKKQQHV